MQVSSDQIVQVAARFVNQTSRTIFLTGKAGTGKTTFIRDIVSRTHKNAIVAAPTGIAAINAGGVTLHSLFSCPLPVLFPRQNPFRFTFFNSIAYAKIFASVVSDEQSQAQYAARTGATYYR